MDRSYNLPGDLGTVADAKGVIMSRDDLFNGIDPLAARIANLLISVADDGVCINEASLWLEELVHSSDKANTIKMPRYDGPLDELYQSTCQTCEMPIKVVNVYADSAEVECSCGVRDVDFVPESEMAEEMIRY